MNSKRVLMLILIGLAISAVIFGIGINGLGHSEENTICGTYKWMLTGFSWRMRRYAI